MGVHRNFSKGGATLSYYLYFWGCWCYNANERSQNVLLFLHHKENAPWKHMLHLHLFWNLFQIELYTRLPQECTFCYLLQHLLNWCTNLVIIVNSTMGIRRGGKALWILKNSPKKYCFLSFERKKTNFTTFAPSLEKFWKNALVVPPCKKSFQRPWTPNTWVWNGLELSTTLFTVLSLVCASWTKLTSEIFCSNGFLRFGYQKFFFLFINCPISLFATT